MKIYNLILAIMFFIFVAFGSTIVFAHPGRTDSSGCHICRTNCPSWGLSSGEYHCHQSRGLPQPEEPIRSHYGESGTGTTEPWQPYQNPSTPSSPPASPSKTIIPKLSTPAMPSITYSIARGMQNGQVTKLQQILSRYPDIYPEGLITGYFGLATERAVKRFQKKYGLEQAGYAGPKTRALLNSL